LRRQTGQYWRCAGKPGGSAGAALEDFLLAGCEPAFATDPVSSSSASALEEAAAAADAFFAEPFPLILKYQNLKISEMGVATIS